MRVLHVHTHTHTLSHTHIHTTRMHARNRLPYNTGMRSASLLYEFILLYMSHSIKTYMNYMYIVRKHIFMKNVYVLMIINDVTVKYFYFIFF